MAIETVLRTPSDHQIVSERVFNAPRKLVFAAFTDPDLIPEWWGPRSVRTSVEELDLRAGGGWRFVCRDAEGRADGFRGTYGEVIPPERLVHTFEWEGMPGHLVGEASIFEELGVWTRVTTTSVFTTCEDRDGMLASGMESGLRESYERLDDLLARLQVGS